MGLTVLSRKEKMPVLGYPGALQRDFDIILDIHHLLNKPGMITLDLNFIKKQHCKIQSLSCVWPAVGN